MHIYRIMNLEKYFVPIVFLKYPDKIREKKKLPTTNSEVKITLRRNATANKGS